MVHWKELDEKYPSSSPASSTPIRHTKGSSKIILSRYDDSSDKESELGGFDSNAARSSTKAMVFREASTMDDDDQSINERGRPRCRVGLKKKMKLSVSNTGITESLENFCVWHKKARQSNDPRPQTTDAGKLSKPYSQPSVERGIRSPQRNMTAGKLSSIANTKYPDSIFKVFIPEGNRVIKQKRVIPLEMRPQTPPRTAKTMNAQKFLGEKPPKLLQDSNAPKGRPEHPQQVSKLTAIPQNKQPEKLVTKTATESSGSLELVPQCSDRAPKRMTLITDISLTKEQEEKRLKDREMMRRRTMNSVKKACPSLLEDGGTQESQLDTDTDPQYSDSDCIDMSSVDNNKVCPSKSTTSSRSNYTLSSRRSVTWATDLDEDSVNNSEKARTISKQSKGHLSLNECSNSPEMVRRITSNQRPARSFETRRNSYFSKRMPKISFKTENIQSNVKQNSGSRHSNVRRPPLKHIKSRDSSIRKKSAVHFDCNTGSDTSHNTRRETYGDEDDHSPSPQRMSRRKEDSKESWRVKCRYCRRSTPVDSSRVFIYSNKTKSKNNQLKSTRVKIIETPDEKITTAGQIEQKYKLKADSFHDKRHAIINKHISGNEVLINDKGRNSDSYSNESLSDWSSKTSRSGENRNLNRRCSTPSIVLKSNIDDYSHSNSEIYLGSYEGRSINETTNEQHSPRMSPNQENDDDKPLRKIFQTGKKLVSSSNDHKTAEEKSETQNQTDKNNSESNDISKQNDQEDKFQQSSFGPRSEIFNLPEQPITSPESQEPTTVQTSTVNSKSLGSLNSPYIETDSNQSLKKTSSVGSSKIIRGQIEPSYLMVETYNVHTEVEPGSISSVLAREPPMLNIPLGEHLNEPTDQVNKHQKFNDNKTYSNDNTSVTTQLNVAYPVSAIIVTGQTEDEKQSIVSGVDSSKESIRAPRLVPLLEFPSEASRSSLSMRQRGSPSSPRPLSENKTHNAQQVENRKVHLRKMLIKKPGEGPSKVANDIKSKWNSTQKSIQTRKDKMLASLRNPQNSPRDTIPSGLYLGGLTKLPQDNECPPRGKGLVLSCDDVTNSNLHHDDANDITDDGCELEETESYFGDLIDVPGSRTPQPYSSIDFLKASSRERDRVAENLSSYPLDSTPEKPLCESETVTREPKQQENNVDIGAPSQERYVVVDNEVSLERDDKRVRETIFLSRKEKSNEYFNNTQNPAVDVGPKHLSPRVNNNKTVAPSSVAVANTHSDKSKAFAAKKPRGSASPQRNPTTSPASSRTVSRVPVGSRPMNSTRNAHLPRDGSSSRSNDASPGSSTKRSNRTLERPPSRKPHMVEISDEDSDQYFFLHAQPSPINLHEEELCLRKHSSSDTQKKTPPCRMYSTLKDSPHSAQESLKCAIRDGLKGEKKHNSNGENEKSTSNGSTISQEGGASSAGKTENSPVSPLLRTPRKCTNVPRMSQGSQKILQSKTKSTIPNKYEPKSKISRTNMTDTDNAWVTSTRRQELKENDWTHSTNEKINKRSNRSSPLRTSGESSGKSSPVRASRYSRPQFRTCNSINRTDEDPFLSKLKPFSTIHQLPPNYLPPWERVDLTPPDSALKERAIHEKRLGIVPRGAADLTKSKGYSSSAKNSRSKSIGGGISSPSSTPIGSRTPGSCRTPLGDMSPVGCRTPVNYLTPAVAASRTPIGDRRSVLEKSKVPSKPVTKSSLQVSNGSKTLINHPDSTKSGNKAGEVNPPSVLSLLLEKKTHDSDSSREKLLHSMYSEYLTAEDFSRSNTSLNDESRRDSESEIVIQPRLNDTKFRTLCKKCEKNNWKQKPSPGSRLSSTSASSSFS